MSILPRARPVLPEDTASKPTTWFALVVALAALNGGLYLTLGMGYRPDPLALYQRGFILAIVALLAVGLVSGAFRPGGLSLLALPMALAGTLLGGLNIVLERTGVIDSFPGIHGLGSVCEQSILAQGVLLLVIFVDVFRRQPPWLATMLAFLLGVGLAFFAVKSVPLQ